MIGTLKMLGYKTAILSGGFTFFARHLQERLGIDYVFANELDIVDGGVTGEVRTEIVDGARKAAPAGDTSISQAQAAVTSAKTAVESAIPALAEGAANAALALIPLGSLLAPEVDQIITLVIQKLEGQLSSPAPAPTGVAPGAVA